MMRYLFFLILILLSSFSVMSQDSTQTEVKAFNISDISSAIEETNSSLKIYYNKIESGKKLNNILDEFNESKKKGSFLLADTSSALWEGMSLYEIERVKNSWQKYRDEIKVYDELITEKNHQLDDFVDNLNKYEDKWKITSEQAKKDSVAVIEERIESIIASLEEYRVIHKKVTELSFNILDSITRENILINDVISKIKVIYDRKKEMIFVKDSPGFFEMISEPDSARATSQLYASWENAKKENLEFLRNNKIRIYGHFFIFLVVLALFYYMKFELKDMEKKGNLLLLFDNHVLKHPLALSFLFSLTLFFWYYPNRPRLLSEQIVFMIIIPVTWILYDFMRNDFRWAFVSVVFLYFIEQVQQLMLGQTYVVRWLLMIEAVAGLGIALYLARPKSFLYHKQRMGSYIIKLFPIVPVILAISVYANFHGSVFFARILASSVVKGSAAAIILFMFVSIIEGFVEFLIASPLNERIHLFKKNGKDIIRGVRLVSRIWATYTLVFVLLRILQLEDGFLDNWEEFLAYGWDFGEVSLSIELIFNFILIIIIFSIVANITRALLEVELLPRLDLKKGIPMAIATVTRYLILVLGFFMAVAAAGISLDKLGFLAGALGVGIGFGLQNVVGNFVSGLILVFERPIHIDDVIVTENIEGVVKEIGIRASKIRSWDGAEVIVPNMDLISRQVTNWTLSDTNRRRELILKLEYGSNPNQVVEIVKEVLDKNEEVMKDPNPMVLFLGYQQYSIDFRILFWLNGNMLQITSDVTLAIHNELKKAGIEVAIPRQRMIWDEKSEEKVKNASAKKVPTTKRKKSPPNPSPEGNISD